MIIGVRRLAFGVWRSALGARRLAFGGVRTFVRSSEDSRTNIRQRFQRNSLSWVFFDFVRFKKIANQLRPLLWSKLPIQDRTPNAKS
jgi:hypothetical protein